MNAAAPMSVTVTERDGRDGSCPASGTAGTNAREISLGAEFLNACPSTTLCTKPAENREKLEIESDNGKKSCPG